MDPPRGGSGHLLVGSCSKQRTVDQQTTDFIDRHEAAPTLAYRPPPLLPLLPLSSPLAEPERTESTQSTCNMSLFHMHATSVIHLQHLTYEVKPSFLPAAPGPDCRRRPANSQTCCHARLGGTLSSPVGGATAPRGALSRAPPPDWACPRWALNDDRDEPRRHEQLETPSTEAELQTEVPQPTEHKTGMH